IDAPVKCYSQGMFVRLAFAIAVHMDSDIFLVDDTLSVGDEYFQRKCIKEIFKIKQQGRTVLVVTHDMGMLQKLCARTIFLKHGMLIRNEETSKAVSFYSQTVGSPKGIAVVEKGKFGLAFNNGKLLLNWDGRLITAPSGAYVVFNSANRWYSSTQAEWEVKEEAQGAFTATGKIYQLGLTQFWRFELLGEREIKWDIELEMDADVELSEVYVNLALKDEYCRWFSNLEKGDFPPIKNEDKNWSTIFTKNGLSARIGVYRQIQETGELPSLLFEQLPLGSSTQGLVLNSDHLSHCRILQYKLNPSSGRSGNQTDRFICFAGKIRADIPDIDGYLSKAQNEFAISAAGSRLVFDNGMCILEHNGLELTKNNHIFISIYAAGRWYFSNLAQWNFEKQGESKIRAVGSWPGLPLSQIWEIEAIGDGSFKWDVAMQIEKEMVIEQQYFSVYCSSAYSQWASDCGSGEFPVDFRETEMDMLQICLPGGSLSLFNQDGLLPALHMRFSSEFHNYAKIMNSNFYEKARLMRVDKVEPEKANKFTPGKYPCFKLAISAGDDKRAPDLCANEMGTGKFRFVFNQGSGRLFWSGKELTKRIGLYTSLCSRGRWHDSSSSARWMAVEKSADVIRVTGRWLYLPVIQHWEVSLRGEGVVDFLVRMELSEKIEIEALQTNLMLLETYSRWSARGKLHVFPGFNDNIDDKWDVIYSSAAASGEIGVAAEDGTDISLPAVSLAVRQECGDQLFNIVNSDIYHRGRVLQCLLPGKSGVASGDFLYFSGRISVDGGSIRG
ncbi:MAG: hypothetical protein PHO81_04480, partial [Candidatus Omnitrophica bacterium]|nr:hypothetical protein [Candidatus Omnitrophota bacterium]